jgi:uncharacterized protein
MTEISPLASTLGGALIGLSALILMLFHGQIAGISGILARILPPTDKSQVFGWRLSFLLGIILAPILYTHLGGGPIIQVMSENKVLMASAGLLVGIGTGISSGCTSGHGVCGISRLSKRSTIATIVFMLTGFLTVYVIRHLLEGLS